MLWHQGEDHGTVPVPTIDSVVDTTAAGDSFNAGFLAEWERGQPPEIAIAAASRLAGRVVQGRGALVPVAPDALVMPDVSEGGR